MRLRHAVRASDLDGDGGLKATISGSSGTVASGITDGMSSDQTADSGKSYLNSTTYPST